MSAAPKRDTVDAWRNQFGNDYIERNVASEEAVKIRTRAMARVLDPIMGAPPKKILEVGCNIGINQRAMSRFLSADMYAIEPNAKAREIVLRDRVLAEDRLFDAVATDLPF